MNNIKLDNKQNFKYFEYIETFYNTKRRHKQLNNLTIKEYNQLTSNNLKNAA